MTTTRSVGVLALAAGLVGLLGACSDENNDGPPATDAPSSLVDEVAVSTIVSTVGTAATDTGDTVPSSGLGAINGPASVDSSFGGANPGGDEGGG